jgi:hypothetical protein
MALFGKKRAPPPAASAPPPAASAPPLLNPVVGMIVADVALRAGQNLVRRSLERGLMKGQAIPTTKPGHVIRGRTLTETVVGTVLAEVARRSVPGAILVGGGLVAKTLRDRARARHAKGKDPK